VFALNTVNAAASATVAAVSTSVLGGVVSYYDSVLRDNHVVGGDDIGKCSVCVRVVCV
jgi:hypothetical protein